MALECTVKNEITDSEAEQKLTSVHYDSVSKIDSLQSVISSKISSCTEISSS